MQAPVVPDASIIIKWTLPAASEPAGERALDLLARWQAGDVDLVAPSLWRYEVANVLSRKAARHANALLAGVLALDLPTVDLDARLLGDAVGIAIRCPATTVYDAAYHALALAIRGTSLTADAAYFRRTKRLGAIELLRP